MIRSRLALSLLSVAAVSFQPLGGLNAAPAKAPGASSTGGAELPDREITPREWLARPLRVVLQDWRAETGIKLRASHALQEQKVTVALPEPISTRRVLPALAALLQSHWTVPKGATGTWTLERLPDVARQLTGRRQRHHDLAARIRLEQPAELGASLGRALKAVDEPPRDQGEGIIGWRNVSPGAEPLIRLLGSLPAQQREHLFRSPHVDPPHLALGGLIEHVPVLPIPFDGLNASQQSLIRRYYQQRGVKIALEGSMIAWANRNGTSLLMLTWFADGTTDLAHTLISRLGPAALEKELKQDEPLLPPIPGVADTDVKQLFDQRLPEGVTLLPKQELDYAEAVVAASKALRVPVLADYYTQWPQPGFPRKAPASQIVAALCRNFGGAAVWTGDTLLLRSLRWDLLDEREIPQNLLDRWVEYRRAWPDPARQVLPLKDLAEMAATLRPQQMSCLAAFRSRDKPPIGFLAEQEIVAQSPYLLRLYRALSETQQQQLLLGGLLPLTSVADGAAAPARELVRQRAPWLLDTPQGQRLCLRLHADAGAESGAQPCFWVELIDPERAAQPLLRYRTAIPLSANRPRPPQERPDAKATSAARAKPHRAP